MIDTRELIKIISEKLLKFFVAENDRALTVVYDVNNIRFRQFFVERNKNAVAAKRRNICRYPIVGVLSDTGNMSFIIGDFVEKCAEFF